MRGAPVDTRAPARFLTHNKRHRPRDPRTLTFMSRIGERIASWFGRQRRYVPPPGRLAEDPTRRLPSGGMIQRLPGDDLDPGRSAGGGRDGGGEPS